MGKMGFEVSSRRLEKAALLLSLSVYLLSLLTWGEAVVGLADWNEIDLTSLHNEPLYFLFVCVDGVFEKLHQNF